MNLMHASWRDHAVTRTLRRALRLVATGLAGIGFLFVVATTTPLVSWWTRALAGPWHDPTGDVLIVLGGSLLDNGFMGDSSYWRSVYAVIAWREGGFRQVIVSGGGSGVEPIAVPMRDFLECHGIPSTAIRLDTRANSTRENALYVKALLSGVAGRKVLLTSDYHMFRAYRTFRKVGLDVVPRPFPDASKRASHWQTRWSALLTALTETVKIAYYYARGWL
jgi:uncharacterized SAM-binding protein YcdF (DUF218 family)